MHWTCNLMDNNQGLNPLSNNGNSWLLEACNDPSKPPSSQFQDLFKCIILYFNAHVCKHGHTLKTHLPSEQSMLRISKLSDAQHGAWSPCLQVLHGPHSCLWLSLETLVSGCFPNPWCTGTNWTPRAATKTGSRNGNSTKFLGRTRQFTKGCIERPLTWFHLQ